MSIDDVERRQQRRDDYLVALYDLSDGDVINWPTHRDLALRMGFSVNDCTRVGMQLAQEHPCEPKTVADEYGQVAITALGVRRAEEIIRRRDAVQEPRYSTIVVLTDAELRRHC